MAGEWPRHTLNELCSLITDGKHGDCRDDAGSGFYFLSVKDVVGGQLVYDDAREIAESDFQETHRRTNLEPGDVLFTNTGTIGRMAIAPDAPRTRRTTFQKSVAILKPRRDLITSRFLYYMLRYDNARLSEFAGGTTQKNLLLKDFRAFQIAVPDLREQQAIACILGSLDDKIELNRRMNRTLEGMARTIFKSWFVDFDPVRAKAAGRKPPGLTPALANLFPDRFEDSELGKVPKGWRVRPLPEIIQINPTRSLPKGRPAPYLDMSNMPTQGPSPDAWIMREAGSGMKFINGDTLVARITPCLENGKTAFVNFLADGQTGWGSTEYIVLRPKGDIPQIFAYLLARWEDFRTFAIHQMTGSSGRQRVPADSLTKFKLATPDINSPLFATLGKLTSPLFERIETAIEESRTLAALRDTLLPKLISGELRVPDAERIVGRRL